MPLPSGAIVQPDAPRPAPRAGPGPDTQGPACRIALKVVPGARQSRIAGPLGERLKVRVASPPENGRANAEVCELLAAALNLSPRQVSIVSGHTHPEKTARAVGITADEAARLLGLT